MGDQGSDKSTQQNTSIENKQVTQSGNGQVGISGSSLYQSSVTVIDGDAQTAQGALGLANNAVALSAGIVSQTLKNFDDQQDRMNSTVRDAVAFAGEVSLKSAQSPATDVAQNLTKQVLTAAVIGLGIMTVVFVTKKK
jgi:hypothetical protein